ncbi:cyclohexanecarboxylate-CoA ligase, partial [Sphingomonas sp. S-NIH.Pt3_0716]
MAGTGAGRRITAAGWDIRWDADQAAQAYADGWWRSDTAADALAHAARDTPDRILLIDGDHCLTAAGLHDQAQRLAQALLVRFPVGSLQSLTLHKWQEA